VSGLDAEARRPDAAGTLRGDGATDDGSPIARGYSGLSFLSSRTGHAIGTVRPSMTNFLPDGSRTGRYQEGDEIRDLSFAKTPSGGQAIDLRL
jgi:hypothetical protein